MSRDFFAGVHEDATPLETISRYPEASTGRMFVPGQQEPNDLRRKFDRLTEPWLNVGGRGYVSYKPRPEDVAAGAWTTHHRQIGAWLADHREVAVIVWHEPEDNMPGEAFEKMFNRARKEIKQGWAGARVVYCAMAYQYGKHGRAREQLAAFQKVTADEYLVDVYSGKTQPAGTILPDHPEFTIWYDGIVKPRLAAGEAVDWGLGERGFQTEDSDVRVDAIRRESAWLKARREAYASSHSLVNYPPHLYLGWSSPGTENDKRWVFDKPAVAAMRELTTAFATSAALQPVP